MKKISPVARLRALSLRASTRTWLNFDTDVFSANVRSRVADGLSEFTSSGRIPVPVTRHHQPQQDPQRPAHREAVAILLCTYDGASWLPHQLDSIRAQTHDNWRIIVSDDGSSDHTRSLLAQFQAALPSPDHVQVRDGPRRGAVANFMSLVSDPAIRSDYFAYCDQDDVWHRDKLERALAWLKTVPADVPAVYGSRTRAVASDGRPLHLSPHFRKPTLFRNALVQNVAGGNTMVMNGAARALLVAAGPLDVVAHDWWTYLLVSGAGGMMLYDPAASVDYRQHGNNQIGANQGFSPSLRRLVSLARGQLMGWNDINMAALMTCAHLLTPQNKSVVESFCAMRKASLRRRITLWREVRPYRQTTSGHLALLAAMLARKI
jgi:glycosyltransferase involved in cell wall biosynthesis